MPVSSVSDHLLEMKQKDDKIQSLTTESKLLATYVNAFFPLTLSVS